MTSDMAEPLGFDRPMGVLINGIWQGAAADRGDIQVGDVVLQVNGRDVNDPKELAFRVASLAIGGQAELLIARNGANQTHRIKLEVAPDEPPRDLNWIYGNNPLAGASILNFNPAVAEELQIDRFVPGVLIVQIKRGTPAARLGFRPGDRITVINEIDIETVSQARDIVAGEMTAWDIKIDRNGRELNLVVGP